MCNVKGVACSNKPTMNSDHCFDFLAHYLCFLISLSLLSSALLPATAGGCCEQKSFHKPIVQSLFSPKFGRQTKLTTSW